MARGHDKIGAGIAYCGAGARALALSSALSRRVGGNKGGVRAFAAARAAQRGTLANCELPKTHSVCRRGLRHPSRCGLAPWLFIVR
jgi:hypothetical protein